MHQALPFNSKPIAYICVKRLFDIVLSSFILILFSPLILLIAILIKATSKGPVFYRGLRTGQGDVSFRLLKFRTMVANAEQIGGPSTGKSDPRVTPVGRNLRAFKFDELPNLINVLLGQMSLVGPRPEVLQYTNLYEGDELLILTVKPGVTDFSSLHFLELSDSLGETNVDLNYEKKVKPIKNKLRVKYAKEASFFIDMKVLFLTAIKLVLKRSYKAPPLSEN